jgi:hypothetical protein
MAARGTRGGEMFWNGESAVVVTAPRPWDCPVEIEAHAGGVAFARGEGTAERPLRLVVRTRYVDGHVRDELRRLLASVGGVVPAEVQRERGGYVKVPAAEPDGAEFGQLWWRVTDGLTLVCDERRAWFGIEDELAEPDDEDCPEVDRRYDLTLMEAWNLVRALAGVQTWRVQVELRARQAARELRREVELRRRAASLLAGDLLPDWSLSATASTVESLGAQLVEVEEEWAVRVQAGNQERDALTRLAARRVQLAGALAEAWQYVLAAAQAGEDYVRERKGR